MHTSMHIAELELAAGSEKLLSLNTSRQESRLSHVSTKTSAAPAAGVIRESPPPPVSPFTGTVALSSERQALLPSRQAIPAKGPGSELQTEAVSSVSPSSPSPLKVPLTSATAVPSSATSPGTVGSKHPLSSDALGHRPVALAAGAVPGRQSLAHHTEQGLSHVAGNSSVSPSRVLPSRDRGISPAKLADLQKQNEALRHKLQVLLAVTLVIDVTSAPHHCSSTAAAACVLAVITARPHMHLQNGSSSATSLATLHTCSTQTYTPCIHRSTAGTSL